MLSESAIQRLQESASHIAIVGRFTTDRDPSHTVRTVRFSEARDLIKFGVYSKEITVTIGGKSRYKARIIVEPKRITDAEVAGAKAMPITGTALQRELQKLVETGAPPDYAEIGGRIVAGLFRSLDALMPFWHPNFDVLLTEGFYLARLPKRDGELVDSEALRRTLYHPVFSRLLTSYLRAPEADAEAIYAALSNAYPGEEFRKGTATTEAAKLKADLLADIMAYREWLQLAGDDAVGPHALFAVLADKKREPGTVGAKVADRLRTSAVPGHTDPKLSLKQVYAAYRVANEDVARVARSEQLMAFITAWYFSAFGDDYDLGLIVTEAHRKLYAENTRFVPTGIDAALAQELEDIFIESQWKEHRAKFGYDETSPSARASIELVRTAIAQHLVLRQPGRVFTSRELLLWLGTSFSDLASKFIEGMATIRKRVEKAAELFVKAQKAIDRNFARAAESGRQEVPSATPESLEEALRKTFETWDKEFAALPTDEAAGSLPDLGLVNMLEKVLAAGKNLTGDDLCKALLRELAEREGRVQSEVIVIPIDARRVKIDEHGRSLTNAYMRQLENARGALVAGGSTAGLKNPAVTVEEDKKRRVEAVATAGLPASIPLPASANKGAEPKSPFDKEHEGVAYQAPDEENPGGVLILTAPYGREELEALEVATGDKVLPQAIEKAVTDLVEDQILVAATKQQIAEDKELYGRKDEAAQRARLRALLFAEHMLAARAQDSVLDREDTSLLAKIALNTILHVGRDEGFGTGNFDSLVKANPTDKGFLDVPIWEILDAPSIEAALDRLSEFLRQVRAQCDGVVQLTTYVAEMNDVSVLLESLGQRGGGGWVTFVDDTIDGIVSRATDDEPLPLLEVSSDSDVPPPGVVYVTRQAGVGSEVDLDGLFMKETDRDRPGALSIATGSDSATRLQRAALAVKLGFPLFVGYALRSTHLAKISAPVNNLFGLVACASGKLAALPADTMSKSLARIMDRQLKIIATEKETTGRVWTRFLTERPDVLRELLQSKLIASAIAHRQLVGTTHSGTPDYKDCLIAARIEAERLLGRLPLLDKGLWVAAGSNWLQVGYLPGGLPKVDNQFAIASTVPTNPSSGPDPLFDLL